MGWCFILKVAIDVVPIRANGEIGGALHVVIELLKGLALRNKFDQYFLLTAEWNHDFFEQFERYGMKRVLVEQSRPKKTFEFKQIIIKKLYYKFGIKLINYLNRNK